MNTSKIHYIDRGAAGAGDMPSECNTKAYMQGDIAYVPTMKRLCVKAFTGKGDNDNLQYSDLAHIATYINAQLGTNGVSVGMVNQLAKVLAGDGTLKIGSLPEHDPSIDTKNPPPEPKTKVIPGVTDGTTPIGDIVSALDAFGKIAGFLTDPSKWLAILSLLIGFIIFGFAIFKGVQGI
jgi:hypothetical protein